MFPPGNASAEVALRDHLRHREAWYADLVGPLLVPVRAWDDFAAARESAPGRAVTVVLIGTTAAPATLPRGVTLKGVEVAVPDVPLPTTDPGLTLAAEITPGPAGTRVLSAVGELDGLVVAKLRTGGVTADAFPSEEVVAKVLASAAAVRAPLKLTAGLHHAVRYTDAETGFENHGFLNVLLAVVQALDGEDAAALRTTLATRDTAVVLARLGKLSAERLLAARRGFVSFGCCGVEEPIDDLVGLGLVETA